MRKQIGVLLSCIGLLLGIGSASIYAWSEISVSNHFETGVVDIELNEYTIENGQEVVWKNQIKNILPGQDIIKIPRIKNDGNDCYVRASIDFIHTPLTVDSVYGIEDEWILANDGYYYYKNILSSGDTVDLFKGIKIPEDLDSETQDSIFEIQVKVDAVQSSNFTPDYSLEKPWGNVEILECNKEGMYDVSTFKKTNYLNFEIKYEDSTGKLIQNSMDFFENFPVLFPGDYYRDELILKNDSEDSVHIYFRSYADEGTDLLDHVYLKLKKSVGGKESIFYEGSIRALELEENLLLTTLENKEQTKIYYEIFVPEYLNNDYTLLNEKVVWIFGTEPILEKAFVQTGDETFFKCLIAFSAGFVCFALGLILRVIEKERRRDE